MAAIAPLLNLGRLATGGFRAYQVGRAATAAPKVIDATRGLAAGGAAYKAGSEAVKGTEAAKAGARLDAAEAIGNLLSPLPGIEAGTLARWGAEALMKHGPAVSQALAPAVTGAANAAGQLATAPARIGNWLGAAVGAAAPAATAVAPFAAPAVGAAAAAAALPAVAGAAQGWAAKAAGALGWAGRAAAKVVGAGAAVGTEAATNATTRGAADVAGNVLHRLGREAIQSIETAVGPPRFSHAITVSVRGGPQADLRRVWYLALAACFGRYRRGLTGVWGRTLNAQWDITGKSVQVTLAYTFSGRLEGLIGVARDENGLTLLQRGPDQVTVGGGFPSWMYTLRNIALGLAGGQGWAAVAAAGGNTIVGGGGFRDTLVGFESDKQNAGRLSLYTTSVSEMRAGTDLGRLDPARLLLGWRVDNNELRPANQPLVPARVFQPWRTRQQPNVFRELPLRAGTVLVPEELIPYRRIRPGTIETTEYVRRGGPAGNIPILPDDGRLITTGEKNDKRVQPPKPPVDGVSRGHPLAMITAALYSPGVLVAPPPDTDNTLGSEGAYAYLPGTEVDISGLTRLPLIAGQRNDPAVVAILNNNPNPVAANPEVPADVINVTQE